MAYKLNNTFGTLLVTLADGTIDVATTDLTLIGKGYAGFGEKLNENLIKLLENFNNTTAPTNKQQGQMWYDKTNNQINVYTGSKWKPVGSPTNSPTQPTNAVQGDMWFDTSNTQLYVYTGSAWTLIGPTTVAGSGVTQVVSEVSPDNTGVNQSYLKLVANDSVVGVVSDRAFTPSSTDTTSSALITAGFATVAQGIQLSSAVSSVKFRGTSTDSDALGGVVAAGYLRSNTEETTSERLSIQSDNGLRIGAGNDVTMTLSSDNFTLANTTQDKDIIFSVNDNGSTKTPMTIQGSTGRVIFDSEAINDLIINNDLVVNGNLEVKGTQTIINTTTLSVEDNIIELNRNISTASAMPNYTGLKVNRGNTSSATEQDLFWVWDETFADDGSSIYGNAGGAWTAFKSGGGDELSAATLVDIRANVIHARATEAQYADLAENYLADGVYEVGTVMAIGGEKEITAAGNDMSVIGVVSGSPAFLMNSHLKDSTAVAIKGRVPVKIQGAIRKGDRVGLGETAGCGTKTPNKSDHFAISLQDNDSDAIKLVECFIV